MLDENIKKYIELQKQEEEIKARKEDLKSLIIEELNGQDKYNNDFANVTVVLSESIKYANESDVIGLMRQYGYKGYIKEKIDTTPFNKFLRDNPESSLYKALKEKKMINSNFTEKLTIKEVK